ncbi:MAG TPA: PspC domain-containing protein [Actinomycetaceae bacterium]|nr:PspC domain-containing protein [Actinomycetaceae bacterium]
MEQPTETLVNDPPRGRPPAVARASDRWIGGIAAGLAHRLGVDPALIRSVFILLALIGPLVIGLYGLGWLFFPDSVTGRSLVRELVRGRPNGALVGGATMVALGLGSPLVTGTASWLTWWPLRTASPTLVLLTWWVGLLALLFAAFAVHQGWRARHHRREAGAQSSSRISRSDDPGMPTSVHWEEATTTAFPPGASFEATPVSRESALLQRKRTSGPNRRTTLITLALALLAAGIALLFHLPGLPAGALLVSGGAAVVILGAGVVISGLRGRRGGLLTALTVLLVPALLAGTSIAAVLPDGMVTSTPLTAAGYREVRLESGTTHTEMLLGSVSVRHDVVGAADDVAYRPPGRDDDLDLRLGVGTVSIEVPPESAVEILVHIGAGESYFSLGPGWEVTGGTQAPRVMPEGQELTYYSDFGLDRSLLLRSPLAVSSGADYRITAELGAGSVQLWTPVQVHEQTEAHEQTEGEIG